MFNHYTVGYHDSNHEHHDICTYAKDSFEAYQSTIETVDYLKEHPHSIESILIANNSSRSCKTPS